MKKLLKISVKRICKVRVIITEIIRSGVNLNSLQQVQMIRILKSFSLNEGDRQGELKIRQGSNLIYFNLIDVWDECERAICSRRAATRNRLLVDYTGRFIMFSLITNIYNKKETFVLGKVPREIVS